MEYPIFKNGILSINPHLSLFKKKCHVSVSLLLPPTQPTGSNEHLTLSRPDWHLGREDGRGRPSPRVSQRKLVFLDTPPAGPLWCRCRAFLSPWP